MEMDSLVIDHPRDFFFFGTKDDKRKNAAARASFGGPLHRPQSQVSFGETIDRYPFSIVTFIGLLGYPALLILFS